MSSVLVPFVSSEEHDLELLFTLRAAHIKHGGQISFPGGRLEDDELHRAAALREAHEEVGIHPDSVHVVGQASDLYVNHSNNHVTPIVGFLKQRPTIVMQEAEVQEAFYIPFSDLTGQHLRTSQIREINSQEYKVPFWNVHKVPLWGATAMMLSEIIELHKEFETAS